VDEAYLTSGKMLHLDGIDHDAALWAARQAHAHGTPVCLDAGGPNPHLLDLLPYIDVLIAAEAFVEDIAGSDDIETGARTLRDCGPGIVVTTRGNKGSYSLIGDQSFFTDPFMVDVVDTTGAGDVFHGAYIFGLLQDWDHRSIARFAGATAALKCRKLGGRAGIPTLDTVMAFLHEYAMA
jgi:ribokinase